LYVFHHICYKFTLTNFTVEIELVNCFPIDKLEGCREEELVCFVQYEECGMFCTVYCK